MLTSFSLPPMFGAFFDAIGLSVKSSEWFSIGAGGWWFWQCLETFLIVTLRASDHSHLEVEARDAVEHSTMHIKE